MHGEVFVFIHEDPMNDTESRGERTLTIVAVPFHDDVIEAIYNTQDDTVYVSVRRVCDNLGIDGSRQLQKLKNYHWATVVEMSTVAQDNKRRELAFLPLAQLPMWMTTIRPGKIGASPELVEKLKRYQLEAVDVLAKHFVMPQSSQDPIVALAQSVAGLAQSVITTRQAQLALEGQLARVDQRVDAIQQRVDDIAELRTAALGVLKDLPRSDRPAAPLTTRAKINMRVRQYVDAHGIGDGDDRREEHAEVWRYLYREFKYRYHFDARIRSDKSGKSKLDEIDNADLLEDFYAMVCELLS